MICHTRIDIINSSVPCNHVVTLSLQASARLSTNTEEPDVTIGSSRSRTGTSDILRARSICFFRKKN